MTGFGSPPADRCHAVLLALRAKKRSAIVDAEQFDHLVGYLLEWCDDPVAIASCAPGGERVWQYGGSGTPEIPEFGVCEVASALGMSPKLLDAALHKGVVDAWRVRKVASATREFTIAQAAQADRRLSAETVGGGTPMLCRVSMARLRPDIAQRRRRAGLSGWVDLGRGWRTPPATTRSGPQPPPAAGRCPRSPGAAHTTQTQALRPTMLARTTPSKTSRRKPRPGIPAHTSSSPGVKRPTGRFRRRPTRLPKTVVYLHLDRETGTWSMDGVGPISRAEATDIVGHSHVTLKPVIDLAQNLTYTGYVAPPRLKEQTALRNAGYCTFPSCNRSARKADFDHISLLSGGPPDAPTW